MIREVLYYNIMLYIANTRTCPFQVHDPHLEGQTHILASILFVFSVTVPEWNLDYPDPFVHRLNAAILDK